MAGSSAPRKDPRSGTWWFVVDLPSGPHGKRCQAKRRGFRTKAEAQAAAAMGIPFANQEHRRPGHKGRSRSHYEVVSKQYLELLEAGFPYPAKEIAAERHWEETNR